MTRTAFIGIAAGALMAASPAQLKDVGAVATEKDVYVMLAPEVIDAGSVQVGFWSPDGAYVLLQRNDVKAPTQEAKRLLALGDEEHQDQPDPLILDLWSVRTRKTRQLIRVDSTHAQVETVQWLRGSRTPVAVVLIRDSREELTGQTLYLIDGISGKIKPLVTASSLAAEQIEIDPSPSQPVAILTKMAGPSSAGFALMREDGSVAPLSLPVDAPRGNMAWSQDGKSLYYCVVTVSKTDGKRHREYYLYDFTSRTFLPPTLERVNLSYGGGTDALPLGTTSERAILVTDVSSKKVDATWLTSMTPGPLQRALIAAQSSFAAISPKLDNVLYISQGTALVRPLLKLDLSEYEQLRKRAAKATAMTHGKQAALGLLMYSGDYDDLLPAGDIRESVAPYVKNPDVLVDFVYTFSGKSLGEIKNPAETVIGYVPGPGGRAYVYADGHVKWKDGDK